MQRKSAVVQAVRGGWVPFARGARRRRRPEIPRPELDQPGPARPFEIRQRGGEIRAAHAAGELPPIPVRP